MKALILAILVWLGVVNQPSAFVISGYDPGGEVSTYLTQFDRVAKTGVPVVIDGACVSACTFIVAMVEAERICVTPRASLGVHQATVDGKPDPKTTSLLQFTFYPAWLQDWIKEWEAANGVLTSDVVYIRYDELKKHYRTCNHNEAPVAGDEVADSGDA